MTNGTPSIPQQVKAKIQSAYSRAMADRFSSRYRSGSGIDHLLREIRLYGREAGIDFAETYLDDLVQEAVETAECKQASLTIQTHRWGRAAVAGAASKLEELTALRVEATGNAITLTWADTAPNLV